VSRTQWCPHCGDQLTEVLTSNPPRCPGCRGVLWLSLEEAQEKRQEATLLGLKAACKVLEKRAAVAQKDGRYDLELELRRARMEIMELTEGA
jgi:hypothetical protein